MSFSRTGWCKITLSVSCDSQDTAQLPSEAASNPCGAGTKMFRLVCAWSIELRLRTFQVVASSQFASQLWRTRIAVKYRPLAFFKESKRFQAPAKFFCLPNKNIDTVGHHKEFRKCEDPLHKLYGAGVRWNSRKKIAARSDTETDLLRR